MTAPGVYPRRDRREFICDTCGQKCVGHPYEVGYPPNFYWECSVCWVAPRIPPMPPLGMGFKRSN